uniref:Uncharacterized protein n=1 Tax=Plectus sambesii TaxID=2011161 RepID=A0A914VD05_9BILA
MINSSGRETVLPEDGFWWSARWTPIVGPPPNGSHENKTIDVLCKNCFTNFDTVACVRATSLCFLAALTALFCLARLGRFHTTPSPPCYHRLILFYVLFFHCLVETIEWVLGWTTQSALALAYMRSLELLIICHFYLTLTCRVMHWTSEVTNRISVLGLTLMYVYFTAFLVLGLVFAFEPWKDCYAPYWIWLSAGNAITVQLIVITFILLVRKINAVSAAENMKKEQKRELFSLVWAFESSVMVDLVYHVGMFMLANDEGGCSGVFNHEQATYSMVKMLYEFMTFLLPIWTVLWVFRHRKQQTFDDNSTLSSRFSYDGSLLNPALQNVVPVRNWRRRYRPLNPGQLLPTTGLGYRRLRSQTVGSSGSGSKRQRSQSGGGSAQNGNGVRRVASAPALPITRRGAVNQNLSSPLYPIPEEGSASSSLQSSGEQSIAAGPLQRTVNC